MTVTQPYVFHSLQSSVVHYYDNVIIQHNMLYNCSFRRNNSNHFHIHFVEVLGENKSGLLIVLGNKSRILTACNRVRGYILNALIDLAYENQLNKIYSHTNKLYLLCTLPSIVTCSLSVWYNTRVISFTTT